jgi:hypothetical protein
LALFRMRSIGSYQGFQTSSKLGGIAGYVGVDKDER